MILNTTGLAYTYPKESPLKYTDIQLEQGKHLLIIGRSGSGKTTLLHMLAGLLKPTEGKVLVNNTDVYALSGSGRDRFRGENIGIIFQTPHLIQNFTVKENILSGAYFAGKMQNKDSVLKLSANLSIEGLMQKLPSEISRGEAQRVAIARAVINKPSIILADEPTASLDDNNCKYVTELLMEQAELHGSTLLITTHDQRLKPFFQHIYSLDKAEKSV